MHPRENESEAGVTFPANGMQNPGRCGASACGNFVVRAIGRRKSPGLKGFPISLNGTLIVIPRMKEGEGMVESEMVAVLNAITLPADSFQLVNDALIAGEVVSNTCYRYSVFYPRAL